ncbi:MAG: hypothetical protein KJ556_21495, partial [Gammaproteobacteria bacterium]|nr:hypothetical protein [Gammaproteobacteria bacterium]
EIVDQVRKMLNNYQREIDMAYLKAEDSLDVTFKANLKPDRGTSIKITTEIKFRPEPDIKDKTSGRVDESQMNIFEKKKSVSVIDRRGPVGNPPRFKALGG